MNKLIKFFAVPLMLLASTQVAVADEQAGLEAWSEVYKVFSHPRCVNCHTPDERPRWSGKHYGEARYHGMNVRRGPDNMGMPAQRCSACHGEHNAEKLHGPPGAEVWLLAPKEMVWWQRSSAQICNQIKDPERNGGKTLEEVAEHVLKDKLVLWGWAPGKGREPAPGSAKETFDLLTKWTAEGAPCPTG